MELTGEQILPAPRARVWAALNDPEILKRCIPGCQEIARVSDTQLTARVGLAVGPVKATFTGKVTLSDLDPPNGYRDRKSTRLNSSHIQKSRMPSSA